MPISGYIELNAPCRKPNELECSCFKGIQRKARINLSKYRALVTYHNRFQRVFTIILGVILSFMFLEARALSGTVVTNWQSQFDLGTLNGASFSADGQSFVTYGSCGAFLWTKTDARPHRQFLGHSKEVTCAVFSPDGLFLATSSIDGTAKLWQVDDAHLLRTFQGPNSSISSVGFSPDGSKILAGIDNGTASVWSVNDGTLLFTLIGHLDAVLCGNYLPSGSQIVTGSADRTVKLWSATDGSLIRTFSGHSGWVNSVAVSPDGTQLLSGSSDGTAKLWTISTGRLITTLSGHSDWVNSVAFSPDGTKIATGSDDQTAKLWSASDMSLIKTCSGHSDWVVSVSFSSDCNQLLTAGGHLDQTAKIWDIASGYVTQNFQGHSYYIFSVASSKTRNLVLTGGYDHSAKVWGIDDVSLTGTFQGHGSNVVSAAFSKDGSNVLTGSDDQTAKLWLVADGSLIKTFTSHVSSVSAVAFAPDGAKIVTGSYDQTAKIWSVANGLLLQTLSGHANGVNSVAVSPDGTKILTGSMDRQAKIWSASDGTLIRTLSGHTDWVRCVGFSPDGGKVFTSSDDQTVKIWDSNTGSLLLTIPAHDSYVLSAAFSPDGTRLLTGSADHTAKLWTSDAGLLICTFQGHSDWVRGVAFSSDGTRAITGGGDGASFSWNIQPPTISSDLVNQTLTAGDTLTLAVSVSGGQLCNYLWLFNSQVIANTTTPSLSISNVTKAQEGSYTVILSNAFGSVSSSPASVSINLRSQSISFPTIADATFGDGPITLQATSNSGLDVQYSVVQGFATISSGQLTITGAGQITVRASQSGNQYYAAASDLDQAFNVQKKSQSINFGSLLSMLATDPPTTLTATASSGLPILFTLVSGPANLSGNILTLTGPGMVVVRASQLGNTNFLAAANVDQSFQVKGVYGITSQVTGQGAIIIDPNQVTFVEGTSVKITASPAQGWQFAGWSGGGSGTSNPLQVVMTAPLNIVAQFTQIITLPSIATQPQSQTLMAGSQFDLSVLATSLVPMSFQWQLGGHSVVGATNSSLSITNVSSLNAGNYVVIVSNSIGSVTSSVAVIKITLQNQTISFTPIPDKTYGDADFGLNANASSGLPINFTVVSGPAILIGTNLTIIGTGIVTVQSSQPGNAFFSPANTIQTFTVQRASQAISFGSISNKTISDPPISLTATASSGLPILFTLVSGPASLSGNILTLTGPGMVVVRASQLGSTNFLAAANVDQSFQVKGVYGITSQVTGQGAIIIDPNQVTFVEGTSVKITASPAQGWQFAGWSGGGSGMSNPLQVVISAPLNIVAQFTQIITVPNIGTQPQSQTLMAGSQFDLSVAATSLVPMSFQWQMGGQSIAGATNSSLSITNVSSLNAGNYAVIVSNSIGSVTSSVASLTVNLKTQSITFAKPNDRTYGDPPFDLNAIASSGLPVSYRILSGPASLKNQTLTPTGAGIVSIRASQPGNEYFFAATNVDQILTVQKSAQVIAFNALPDKAVGDAPITLSASASSGLPVTFQVVSGIASLADNVLTLKGASTVTIRASQSGNTNYEAAPWVDHSFRIKPWYNLNVQIQGLGRVNKDTDQTTFLEGSAVNLTAVASDGWIFRGWSGDIVSTNNPLPLVMNAGMNVLARFEQLETLPAIVTQPVGKLLTAGDSFSINVAASSKSVMTYQWQWKGENINDATNMWLTLTNVGFSKAGDYFVVVSNSLGSVTSSVATISVTLKKQTVSLSKPSDSFYGGALFDLSAISSSGLPLIYQVVAGPATIDGKTVAVTGIGTVMVRAIQPGNDYFDSAHADQSFVVQKAMQTITFNPLPDRTLPDSPLILQAIASSGLNVSYQVLSGPAALTGNTLALTGNGMVIVRAMQSGDENYQAAVPVDRSFQVKALYTLVVQVTGSGTVTQAPSQTQYVDGTSVQLTASPSSGWRLKEWGGDLNGTNNPVQLAMIAGRNVTAQFEKIAAIPLIISQPTNQTIVAGGSLELNVVAVSQSSLSYQWQWNGTNLVDGTNSTLSLSNASAINAGSYCVLVSNEVGTVTSMTAVVTVILKSQTISFPKPEDRVYGDASIDLAAAASSGLPIAYTVVSGPACLSGNALTITGASSNIVIRASQAGDAYFSTAPDVTQTVFVAKASQSILFNAMPDRAVGDDPVILSAFASSQLPVDFQLISGSASLTNNLLTLKGATTIIIRATQAGNSNYFAAIPVEQQFRVKSWFGLSVQTQGLGAVERTPDQATYLEGSFVILKAVPVSGWQFKNWNGDMGWTTNNPFQFNMNSALIVTANFEKETQTNDVLITLDSIKRTSNALQFVIHGVSGKSYSIQTSTNLADWLQIKTMTFTNDQSLFQDSIVPSNRRLFYRVQQLP